MKQKNLWILVGLPGSGKSYWAKRFLNDNTVYISRDEIRFSVLEDGEDYFNKEGYVYSAFLRKIQEALTNGYNVIADATHLNWASRRKLIQHLVLVNVNVNCVVFKTSLEVCFQRNAGREGRAHVPEDVIYQMNRAKTHPLSDPYTYHMMKNIYEDGSEEVITHG